VTAVLPSGWTRTATRAAYTRAIRSWVSTDAASPAASILPSCISTSWSAYWPAVVRSCSVDSTVSPLLVRRSSTSSSTCCW
jgi:hypothetical protein